MRLEIMLKHLQVHTSPTEMQRVSTSGNFALDFAWLVKTRDQFIEAVSKVCDGLLGDAFVATQEVGLDNLCEIVDGRPRGIDTLINHMRGMVFLLTEHESTELFRQYCRPGGPLSRQIGESLKQYVSRRRRCWTLPVQMNPVIHLNEGRRSDMLLDLRGLTREARVMVQASINNERDFDRVADALITQHPRIHLRESQRRTKGKGKDGFKTWRQSKHSLVSRKRPGQTHCSHWQRKIWSKCLLRELHFR